MVGTIVQLGGVLVLAGLFVLLRRFVLRRNYFAAWSRAWLALAIAIAAVALRYNVLPAAEGSWVPEGDDRVRLLYYAYQVAKLAAFAWFVDGTRAYSAGARGLGRSAMLWIGVSAYAVGSVLLSADQAAIVVWQSPIAVAAFAWCAWLLYALPEPRRTPGTVTTASSFAFLALLWLVYAGTFGLAATDAHVPRVASLIIATNPYLDLVGSIGLGYGMIIVLMEDAKREVDDAQSALRVAHDDLRRAALYDPLTGAMNRSAFTEGLGLDMARASYGTVVLLDLDNLKEVNDEYGHAGGDMLLRACADALRASLRQTDRLYRWGGDEFLLVLPSARASDVQRRIERVIEGAAPLPAGASDTPVRVQASVGAADFASYDDLRSAIDRADALMYRQKHAKKRAAAEASGRAETPAASRAVGVSAEGT